MSKTALKKHLQALPKERIIETLLDAYTNSPPVKEYFDFYLIPNETEKAEKYKTIIKKEFDLYNPEKAGLKYSVAKKAISEFATFKPSPEVLADVMLTLPEAACEFTYTYGDMEESFYDAAVNNFRRVLIYMEKNGILQKFKQRCANCVKHASPCGYGFADEIEQLFYEYYEL